MDVENMITFVWRIQNFRKSSKKKNEYFESPCFTVKRLWNTKFVLKLYPKGTEAAEEGYLSCQLCILEGPQDFKISSKIFLVDSSLELPKYENYGFATFEEGQSLVQHLYPQHSTGNIFFCDDIYIVCYLTTAERESYTMDDLSTIIPSFLAPDLIPFNCSTELFLSVEKDISKIHKKLCIFPTKFSARTIIKTERKSFTWSMDDILKIEGKRTPVLIVSASEIPDLYLTLMYSTGKSIQVDICPTETNFEPFLSFCKIWISDYLGKTLCSVESEHYFTSTDSNECKLKIQLGKEDLLKELHPSVKKFANLNCEIATSKGDVVSWIEKIQNTDFSCEEFAYETQTLTQFQSKMINLYKEEQFCDVVLKIRGKTFNAHKTFLCSSSPLFNAMLKTEMKENETNTIHIDDLDSDTLDRMLMFMYSDSLQNMNFEAAMKLYKAADKYQIINLQQKCAKFMMSNLTVKNACQALCLGEAHADKNLKVEVSNFIFQHLNEVMNSEEWKEFLKSNVQFANEILQEICLKLSRNQICKVP